MPPKPADTEADLQVHVIAAAEGAGQSAQPAPDEWTPGDSIEPPEDLTALSQLTATNGNRRGIIDAISLNTVGLGHDIVAREGHEHEVEPGQGAAIIERLDACAERDDRLDNPGLSELLQAVKHDEEGCGNGYVEVSRNRLTGQIDGLYHLPGHLMRRRRDRTGWVLGRRSELASERTRFYNFGDKVQYDDQGQALDKLVPGKRWATNEVIRFRLYTSESRDYGLPRDVALANDYLGDRRASEANVSFFDSGGTPPGILFVTGVQQEDGGRITFKVPERTVEKITATLQSAPGTTSRVAVIPVPPGASVDHVQLGQLSERDMAFTDYRKDNLGRQLQATRIAPIFISADSNGRYDAEVQRALTLEQVFDPEQRRYERRLDRILRDMGYRPWRFRFRRVAVEADAARRDSADALGEFGDITIGEHRKAHGMAPFREAGENEQADLAAGIYPFGFNNQMLDGSVPSAPPPGAPPGAENRVSNSAEDQRGLAPGLAGRRQKSTTAELAAARRPSQIAKAMADGNGHHDEGPEWLQETVEDLENDLAGASAEPTDPPGDE
jgi:capsid portal protein